MSDTADFNGSIVFTSIATGQETYFDGYRANLELGTGYYNQRNFYSAIDQSLLIWIRAATNQEGPIQKHRIPSSYGLWKQMNCWHIIRPSNYSTSTTRQWTAYCFRTGTSAFLDGKRSTRSSTRTDKILRKLSHQMRWRLSVLEVLPSLPLAPIFAMLPIKCVI